MLISVFSTLLFAYFLSVVRSQESTSVAPIETTTTKEDYCMGLITQCDAAFNEDSSKTRITSYRGCLDRIPLMKCFPYKAEVDERMARITRIIGTTAAPSTQKPRGGGIDGSSWVCSDEIDKCQTAYEGSKQDMQALYGYQGCLDRVGMNLMQCPPLDGQRQRQMISKVKESVRAMEASHLHVHTDGRGGNSAAGRATSAVAAMATVVMAAGALW